MRGTNARDPNCGRKTSIRKQSCSRPGPRTTRARGFQGRRSTRRILRASPTPLPSHRPCSLRSLDLICGPADRLMLIHGFSGGLGEVRDRSGSACQVAPGRLGWGLRDRTGRPACPWRRKRTGTKKFFSLEEQFRLTREHAVNSVLTGRVPRLPAFRLGRFGRVLDGQLRVRSYSE